MSGKEKVLWGLGFLALVSAIIGAVSLAKMLGVQGRSNSPLVGQSAPSLVLPRVAEGDPVDLAALRGDVVLLDFWASWCGPCRHSIPRLNQVYEAYEGRIQMFGVNVDRSLDRAGVVRAHHSFGAVFPSLIDERGEAQQAFSVSSIPTVVLIDREGVVRYLRRGVPDPDEVSAEIDGLLE